MKNRILIVDDEEGIRFTLNKFLTKAGYEVVTAESFDEAVICIT
ncbi:MAG: response regulator, partial [Nitrospira sp.]|nr:response regulator [Nitrospira sp.]